MFAALKYLDSEAEIKVEKDSGRNKKPDNAIEKKRTLQSQQETVFLLQSPVVTYLPGSDLTEWIKQSGPIQMKHAFLQNESCNIQYQQH